MKYWFWAFLLIIILPVSSVGQNVSTDKQHITITIEPVYNGQSLKLSDKCYVNEHGDSLFIDLFRFYITNLKLSGTSSILDSNSHLVDAEQKVSHTFPISNINTGSYTSLSFTIGVDSITNTNGANNGDLDPSKGMYWAWNSGYIMAKLEGHSKVCKTLHHVFEFHVGGYMPPYNAARTVNIKLPVHVNSGNGKNVVIRITADAAAWFHGNIDLAKTNNIVIPGKEACKMADNYAKMFSVTDIRYE